MWDPLVRGNPFLGVAFLRAGLDRLLQRGTFSGDLFVELVSIRGVSSEVEGCLSKCFSFRPSRQMQGPSSQKDTWPVSFLAPSRTSLPNFGNSPSKRGMRFPPRARLKQEPVQGPTFFAAPLKSVGTPGPENKASKLGYGTLPLDILG